jgi:hypothetical protein
MSHSPLHTAAFIAMGLQMPAEPTVATFNEALDHWDGGCFELVDEATRYAPYIVALLDAGMVVTGGCPGIPEYEVAESFGAWFCQAIIAAPDSVTVPSAPSCLLKALQLVQAFFVQALESEGRMQYLDKLVDALLAVPYTGGDSHYSAYTVGG